jgi:hypothetical protein
MNSICVEIYACRMYSRDENCQGCRRNRSADRAHTLEIMFANDVTLMLAATSKNEQDDWLNAVMKGLSQGVRIIVVSNDRYESIMFNIEISD